MKKKYLYQKLNSKTTIDSVEEELKNEKIKPLFRETYEIKSKSHPYDVKEIKRSIPKAAIRRREEWICKLSLDQTLGELGKVIDYQVPLKVPSYKIENEGRGKIDLLTLNDNTLYLIEYKRFSNNENPLKAICEIYTYYKMLGGEPKKNTVDKRFLDNIRNIEKDKIKHCKPIVLLTEKDDKDKNIKNNIFSKLRNNAKLVNWAKNELGVKCYYCRVNKDTSINGSSIKEFAFT